MPENASDSYADLVAIQCLQRCNQSVVDVQQHVEHHQKYSREPPPFFHQIVIRNMKKEYADRYGCPNGKIEQ